MTYKFKERIEGHYYYVYELNAAEEIKLQLYIDMNGVDTQDPSELLEAIKEIKDEPTAEGTEVDYSADLDTTTDDLFLDGKYW
jgi:hypothetical protein